MQLLLISLTSYSFERLIGCSLLKASLLNELSDRTWTAFVI